MEKDIDGYEGLYQVSNTGKIKSFRFSTRYSKKSENTEHILKPSITREGYLLVTLYSNPNSKKKYTVHQLVAKAFIPNPNNYPTINHKDENKLNNNVGNLEWCTYSYNNSYGTARIRSSITKGKPIQQLTIEGIQLAEYRSIGIAAKLLNISRAGIYVCCSGKIQTFNGYIWRYAK